MKPGKVVKLDVRLIDMSYSDAEDDAGRKNVGGEALYEMLEDQTPRPGRGSLD